MVKVTMLLARGPGAPEGDVADRVEMRVRLNPLAQLDLVGYEADPAAWIVTRTRPGAGPRAAQVLRLDTGWAVQSLRGEDEPLWELAGAIFRPGEIAALRGPDGEELLYRIVAVEAD